MYVFPALQQYYEMVRKHWEIFKSCEIKGLQNNNPHQKLMGHLLKFTEQINLKILDMNFFSFKLFHVFRFEYKYSLKSL